MKGVIDIDYLSLILGYIILIIPFYILWYYKTGLLKDAFFAFIRMTIQLLLVGFYLEYIFELNSSILNLAWVLVMTILATYTVIKRSDLKLKEFFIPNIYCNCFECIDHRRLFFGICYQIKQSF